MGLFYIVDNRGFDFLGAFKDDSRKEGKLGFRFCIASF